MRHSTYASPWYLWSGMLAVIVVLGEAPASLPAQAKPNAGADWPQWRGPNGDGVSREKNWSTDWPASGPPLAWSLDLGDTANNRNGSSTVAVSKGRVYVMGTEHAWCLSAEAGKVIWKIPFPASHSTPAVDGERVYLYGTMGKLVCARADSGKTLWEKNLQRDLKASRPGAYGYAVSPRVVDDLVIVSARINEGALIALDKLTGKVKWKAMHAGHKGYAF